MNTWIVGKDMKPHSQIEKIFTVNYIQKILLMNIIYKLKNYYLDLYVQSDTLLLSDVFENFKNKCIDVYELDPAHFLSAPGLAWQAYLKNLGVKLEFYQQIMIC